MPTISPALRWCFDSLDNIRKLRGAAMDRMGYAPTESVYHTIMTAPGMRLRYYGGPRGGTQVALIIPAPIKRHYIWDLAPDCSVVQRALSAGMQVYLAEWTLPERTQSHFGLADYGHRMIEQCLEAIHTVNSTARVFLFSHSLGGILAAVYAALRPQRVNGLVLVETPLHFADATGSFGPLLALAPPADQVAQAFENVPGSVLSLASVAASPATFQAERYADLVASMDSNQLLRKHFLVERWTLDEAPMAGRLFAEVVDQLYREDHFMSGRLVVNGRAIGPADVVSPFLAVYDPRSLIIPPKSITAFLDATGSNHKRLLPYLGDKGVALAHVGALVGDNAHRQLWPEIFTWMDEVSGMSATRH